RRDRRAPRGPGSRAAPFPREPAARPDPHAARRGASRSAVLENGGECAAGFERGEAVPRRGLEGRQIAVCPKTRSLTGSGFKVQGSRFVRVQGSGFKVRSSKFCSSGFCAGWRRTPNVEPRTENLAGRTRTNPEPGTLLVVLKCVGRVSARFSARSGRDRASAPS